MPVEGSSIETFITFVQWPHPKLAELHSIAKQLLHPSCKRRKTAIQKALDELCAPDVTS